MKLLVDCEESQERNADRIRAMTDEEDDGHA